MQSEDDKTSSKFTILNKNMQHFWSMISNCLNDLQPLIK